MPVGSVDGDPVEHAAMCLIDRFRASRPSLARGGGPTRCSVEISILCVDLAGFSGQSAETVRIAARFAR